MLETLTRGFKSARERLMGVRELSEANVDEALLSVRASLLEADVDFAVVKDFLARVKERALGQRVETRVKTPDGRVLQVTPGQHFIKVCEEELAALMGPVDPALKRDASGAVSILLLGLQGVGKTTVAAKLARHLAKQGLRPLLVAADVYRPAAMEQLAQLGARIGVPVHRDGRQQRRRRDLPACPRAREAGGLRRHHLRHGGPARDRRRVDAASSRRSTLPSPPPTASSSATR